MDAFKNLKEVIDPQNTVGYNMIIDDGNMFGTSDVDLAAFLTQKGKKLIGAVPRQYVSSGRNRVKVIFVFSYDDVLINCLDSWEGKEGKLIRQHKTEYRRMMSVVNDVIYNTERR